MTMSPPPLGVVARAIDRREIIIVSRPVQLWKAQDGGGKVRVRCRRPFDEDLFIVEWQSIRRRIRFAVDEQIRTEQRLFGETRRVRRPLLLAPEDAKGAVDVTAAGNDQPPRDAAKRTH